MKSIKFRKIDDGYAVLEYGEQIATVSKVNNGWCCYANEEEYQQGEGCYAGLRRVAVEEFLKLRDNSNE